MAITTKTQSLRLMQQGLFGNRPKMWSDIDEFLQLNLPGRFTIRAQSGQTNWRRYGLTSEGVAAAVLEIEAQGGRRDQIRINESMPDDRLVFQGEVMHAVDGAPGYYVFGSTLPFPMVTALAKDGREFRGLAAKARLGALDVPSLEQLEYLLDRYPGHVVEFSSYAVPVGELRLNTVFWDVRSF